eukprot:CAMPEP_0202892520 /NCGR_PEP_ID=MMETSP1392-20130828/2245_1 /ASSEMBLY_ACC=CAM_ASM_000868 /TAXON_ID=225041 /ORGANISM="Chlamydomonas chlamydogama, Strain SAG 11-48b" /LENGTH=189 /DNA_ID=CAMNT_0049576509 /DNA_START=73 /DNA_END=642 /DNA_ORIENTATION=-
MPKLYVVLSATLLLAVLTLAYGQSSPDVINNQIAALLTQQTALAAQLASVQARLDRLVALQEASVENTRLQDLITAMGTDTKTALDDTSQRLISSLTTLSDQADRQYQLIQAYTNDMRVVDLIQASRSDIQVMSASLETRLDSLVSKVNTTNTAASMEKAVKRALRSDTVARAIKSAVKKALKEAGCKP